MCFYQQFFLRGKSAKSAFIGTWRRSSRGNAWHARPGNRKMHSWQNMQVHKPHFIVFVRRASKHNCAVFATLAKPNRNLRPRRGNGHAMAVECVWIVRGEAWGWWRCSVCNVKQAASAFEGWLAQHRSCNGDQVCSNCWKCPTSGEHQQSGPTDSCNAGESSSNSSGSSKKKGTCHN